MSHQLYVLFNRPLSGNYLHWALHFVQQPSPSSPSSSSPTSSTPKTYHHIYQVIGTHPNYIRDRQTLTVDPRTRPDYVGTIYVGVLGDADIAILERCVEATVVNNENVQWDCQDYVLDVLDGLEEECVFEDVIDGEADEDYRTAREDLRARRGPGLVF